MYISELDFERVNPHYLRYGEKVYPISQRIDLPGVGILNKGCTGRRKSLETIEIESAFV